MPLARPGLFHGLAFLLGIALAAAAPFAVPDHLPLVAAALAPLIVLVGGYDSRLAALFLAAFSLAGLGVVPGQKVFTMEPVNGVVLFAAWWPWGDDERISLRLGLISVTDNQLNNAEVKALICRWLNLHE